MSDVVIHVPTARVEASAPLPSAEDLLREQLVQEQLKTSTLASIAVALARMVADQDGPLDREIVIPRAVYDKLDGAHVGVSQNADGDLLVRIRDNARHPVWEGR